MFNEKSRKSLKCYKMGTLPLSLPVCKHSQKGLDQSTNTTVRVSPFSIVLLRGKKIKKDRHCNAMPDRWRLLIL